MLRPARQENAPLFKKIRAPIGSLHRSTHYMAEHRFSHVMRGVGGFCHPVPKARTETMGPRFHFSPLHETGHSGIRDYAFFHTGEQIAFTRMRLRSLNDGQRFIGQRNPEISRGVNAAFHPGGGNCPNVFFDLTDMHEPKRRGTDPGKN